MRVALCLVLPILCGGAVALGASPSRHPSSGIDLWGQPSRGQEVANRPLGSNLALFTHGTTVRLPAPARPMRPLSFVAAHMLGKPGTLISDKTRRVATKIGPVYLVPTTHGWVCMQGLTFATCHRGLLRQGLTWDFFTTTTGLDVIGLAANNVRSITLLWSTNRREARLSHNIFFAHRPLSISGSKPPAALGRLTVAYRGNSSSATVSLRG